MRPDTKKENNYQNNGDNNSLLAQFATALITNLQQLQDSTPNIIGETAAWKRVFLKN